MFNYIKELNYIKEFQTQSFAKYSLSPRDYRVLNRKNENVVILKNLLDKNKEYQGKSITSEAYTHFTSPYRFIKTGNINSPFLLDETSIDYMIPYEGKGSYPKYNDVLIAKDGNGDGLGEACIYRKENKNNTDMISNEVHALRIKKEYLYYVFAFLKSTYFKSFFDLNTAQGSTMRHGKKISLDCPIPFPTTKNYKEPNDVVKYLSMLVENAIDKEEQISIKNKAINQAIYDELISNQKNEQKHYHYPNKTTLLKEGRLDTGLYRPEYQKLYDLISNYTRGVEPISKRYKFKRGQNLQISQIGLSIYSKTYKNNFYKLLTNTELKDDRTIDCFRYLGNSEKLDVLEENIVLLSADGTVGRSIFIDKIDNTITNIHMWIFKKRDNNNKNIYENIFLSCYLSWLKGQNFFEYIKDKANGGSIKEGHLNKYIFIPKFEEILQQKIANLYYHSVVPCKDLSLANYLQCNKERNKQLGIYQLNFELLSLRNKINEVVFKIVNNESISICL